VSTTARGLLISVYLLVLGLAGAIALGVTTFEPTTLLPFLGLRMVSLVLTYVVVSTRLLSDATLCKLSGLLGCELFSFGLLYVGAAMVKSGEFRLVIPFLILAGGFAGTTNALKYELSQVTG